MMFPRSRGRPEVAAVAVVPSRLRFAPLPHLIWRSLGFPTGIFLAHPSRSPRFRQVFTARIAPSSTLEMPYAS